MERILAEEFRFRGSLGQQTVGRDGWRAYRDQVRAGAPDFRNEVIELVVGGNQAAARLRYTGTHRGPMLGLDGTGRAFAHDGTAFFRARAVLWKQEPVSVSAGRRTVHGRERLDQVSSVEFSAAACRLGHTLIRDAYQLTGSPTPLPVSSAGRRRRLFRVECESQA